MQNFFFFNFIHWLPTVGRNDMKQKLYKKRKEKLYTIVRRAGSGGCLVNEPPLQYGDICPRAASTFGIE